MNRYTPLLIISLMLVVLASTSCTTIANRRDLYFSETVWGPYTRMLHHRVTITTTQESIVTTKSYRSTEGKNVTKPQG